MAIFLDTSFLVAFYNSSDINHQKSVNLINEMKEGKYGRIITSTYVLDELITYFLKKVSFQKAKSITEIWIRDKMGFASIVDITWREFKKASDLFLTQHKQDRLLSFTDCTIVTNIQNTNINALATFDSGFRMYITVVP